MTQDELKQAAAKAAIAHVPDDCVVGVGTGSTANFFIAELGKIRQRIRGAVASFERQVLRRALERAQFKQTVAAKLLGLSYHQFRSLLRKHGLAKQASENGD